MPLRTVGTSVCPPCGALSGLPVPPRGRVDEILAAVREQVLLAVLAGAAAVPRRPSAVGGGSIIAVACEIVSQMLTCTLKRQFYIFRPLRQKCLL